MRFFIFVAVLEIAASIGGHFNSCATTENVPLADVVRVTRGL